MCYNLTHKVETASGNYIHKPVGPVKFLTSEGLIIWAKASYAPEAFYQFYVTEWDRDPQDRYSTILEQTNLDEFIKGAEDDLV